MRMTITEFERLKRKVKKIKLPEKRNEKLKSTFVLPWPPSVNQMYVNTKKGQRILTKKAVEFYRACEKYFLVQNVPKFYKKATMLIEFFPNSSGGWDASNFFKATEDALVKNGIIPDDQVKYLQPLAPVVHKKIDNRFIKVTLEEI